MGQQLRPYQQRALENVEAARIRGARRVLLVMPTGAGKTTCFGSFLANSKAPGLVLVHRRELADQACARLREFGVDYGLIMAGEPERPNARVQVATIQTLTKRKRYPKARLVIPDEAHLSTAETWAEALSHYPDAFILGVTATPWRLGGKPLSGEYDEVVVGARPSELREAGFLCDFQGFSYKTPDLSAVKSVGGEYNEGQSGAAMRAPQIVADVVERWLEFASHLSTLVFAVTIEHSKDLTVQFRAAGVACEHLDASVSVEERRAILARVASGVTRVLCNVGVAVEGLDIPRIKCVVLARPTKSVNRYLQMIGRGRRPWEGLSLRIHDHSFNVRLHGLPDDERDYSLHARKEDPPELTTCQYCFALYVPGTKCPGCDRVNERDEQVRRELVVAQEAELFEIGSGMALPVDNLPPVPISWAQCKEGRQFEGLYEGTTEERTDWGPRKRHTVKTAKRTYSLQGTQRLDKLMANAGIGKTVRVTYRGRQSGPGAAWSKAHEFTVEVDDAEGESKDVEHVCERCGGRLGVKSGRGRKPKFCSNECRKPSLSPRTQELRTKRSEARSMFECQGLSCRKIGAKLGVRDTEIHRWRTEGDWQNFIGPKIPDGCEEVLAHALAGKIAREISEATRVPESTVRAALKRLTIEPNLGDRMITTAGAPETLKSEIVQRVRAGTSRNAVADEFGSSRTAVRTWCKEAGLMCGDPSKRPKGFSEEVKASVAARVLAGESARTIATELGVDESTVRGWVKSRMSKSEAA